MSEVKGLTSELQPGYPDLPLLNDVDDLPTSLGQSSSDPSPVTFPRKPLGTEEGRPSFSPDLLQFLKPFLKGVRIHISKIPALPEASQFSSQVVIMDSIRLKRALKTLFREMGESARRKTANIQPHFYSALSKKGQELLKGPIARPQSVDDFNRFRIFLMLREDLLHPPKTFSTGRHPGGSFFSPSSCRNDPGELIEGLLNFDHRKGLIVEASLDRKTTTTDLNHKKSPNEVCVCFTRKVEVRLKLRTFLTSA